MKHLMKKLIATLALLPVLALADPVATVEWDPVDDSRVGVYVIGVGSQSGTYTNEVTVTHPTVTADIPDYGYDTYFIVAKACKADLSLCSAWSNEVDYTHEMGAPANLRLAVAALQGAMDEMHSAVALVAQAVDGL